MMPAPDLALSDSQLLHTTRHRVGAIYPLERLARGDELTPEQRMRVGERMPVNPLSGKRRKRPAKPTVQVAHITLTEIRLQRLGNIEFKDARAEGFQTTDEFKIAWASRGRRAATPILDETALELFDTKHADTLVWALSFDVVESRRLLRASASFDDYTDTPSRAARTEPEAITEDQLAKLTQFAVIQDEKRRRQPLVTNVRNMNRELDELRQRMPGEGLHDQSLWNLILAAERIHERILGKLEAA